MHLLRFQRCLAAFRFLPFGSFLSKRQKTKAAKIICRLRSPHTCLASRGAEASKLGPPLYIAMQTDQPQPQLKLKLQLQLLRSLRSLRPPCLRSPCSEGANRSPRYARRTICTFFAFSGVWQLFVFCLLVRSSLKGRKPKQPRLFVAYGLHIPAWRAEGQRPRNSARPSTSPCRPTSHNHNSNSNCNSSSSARYARGFAYGLHITEWRAEWQDLAHSARPSTSPFRTTISLPYLP